MNQVIVSAFLEQKGKHLHWEEGKGKQKHGHWERWEGGGYVDDQ